MSLNPRQQRFVDEYLKDANGTQAVIRAGYSANGAKVTAHRLLTNPNVKEAVKAGQEAIAEDNDVTRGWLIDEFKENNVLAREGNPVIDRYGKPTGGVMRQINASNKALESIAVLTGHWVTKGKVEHGVGEELIELMKRIDGKTRGL